MVPYINRGDISDYWDCFQQSHLFDFWFDWGTPLFRVEIVIVFLFTF